MNRPRDPNVLLVDDDKGLLQLIAMRLGASGYAVTAVESGEAALGSLEVTRPQVVVTDLRMEGIRITSYNVCYTKLLRDGFGNRAVRGQNDDRDPGRLAVNRVDQRKTVDALHAQVRDDDLV